MLNTLPFEYIDKLMWSDLLSWRDFLFANLLLATKLVAIGLLAEGPELICEIVSIIRHALYKRRFHFSLPEDHPPNLVKAIAFTGWFLIAAGVAGEWYIEGRLQHQDAVIQSIFDSRLEAATKEAGSAATSATTAHEEADAVGNKAAVLRIQLRAVAKRAEELTQKLAGAEGRISKAEGSAEQLSKDILEVEAELSDRIFDDQLGAGNRLSKFAPISVVIEYLPKPECGDCEETAGQLFTVLHDFAHWSIAAVGPNPDLRRMFVDGVIVQVDAAGVVSADVKRAEAGSEALILELNKTHIQARSHASDSHFRPGVVVVRIGKKPNPVIQRMLREWEKRNEDLRLKIVPNSR